MRIAEWNNNGIGLAKFFLSSFLTPWLSFCLLSERVLPQQLLLLDLLQQWGARRPEVSFYLRHCPSLPQGTAHTLCFSHSGVARLLSLRWPGCHHSFLYWMKLAFFTSLCGFSQSTPIFSHITKTCTEHPKCGEKNTPQSPKLSAGVDPSIFYGGAVPSLNLLLLCQCLATPTVFYMVSLTTVRQQYCESWHVFICSIFAIFFSLYPLCMVVNISCSIFLKATLYSITRRKLSSECCLMRFRGEVRGSVSN